MTGRCRDEHNSHASCQRSVLRTSGPARMKHVVNAHSLSDLHLNAAASVYLLSGELVPHDWFWLIPSDFHVDLLHFTFTLPPQWPCLRLKRDGLRGNFWQRHIITCFSRTLKMNKMCFLSTHLLTEIFLKWKLVWKTQFWIHSHQHFTPVPGNNLNTAIFNWK